MNKPLILLAFFALSLFACDQINSTDKSTGEEAVSTVKPEKRTIIVKTVANGSIEPRREVSMKSQVSGIVDKLFKEPGDIVTKGELIANIKIIPDPGNLANAETSVNAAKLRLSNAEKEFKRQQALYDKGVIAERDFIQFQFDFDIAQENLAAAETNLEIIREGAAKNSSEVLNQVRSTIDGMILDIPVKEGTNVIESNNFNEGTNIADVADMTDLLFVGNVDESEVGKIKEGMPIVLTVGAIEGQKFDASLEYISPKGVEEDGTIQFEIKASVKVAEEGTFLRAGYSANANIVLDKKEDVLSINEADLTFEKGQAYVEVKKGDSFEKQAVQLGISDGIYVEITDGLDENTEIKSSGGARMGRWGGRG